MSIESITLKEVATAITVISSIVAPLVVFYKMYKKNISGRLTKLEGKQVELEKKMCDLQCAHDTYVQDSKANDHVIIAGLIACLEGLVEQGCDGPVKAGLTQLKTYLINKS